MPLPGQSATASSGEPGRIGTHRASDIADHPAGIPKEAHRYQVNGRSALEWLIDRYQIRTDKASGIVNDPNSWGEEHDRARYIVELVARIVRVSVETMRIVDGLPALGV